jgi:D-3-phosphoglycerate dehydrogenase
VARFGDAFGMAVRAYDSDPDRITAPAQAVPHIEDLLSGCDVVTLHVPLNDDTRGLIGERELALMKPDAVLINTSRGDIIDENTLATALEDGRIAGAALDVVHDEQAFPAPSTARLTAYARGNTNLILTPHIGGATYESMARTEEFIAEKIVAFLSAYEG